MRIGEKLWGGPDLAKLLALCAYTGVLTERTRTVRNATCKPLDDNCRAQLQSITSAISPVDSVSDVLKQLCVDELYPDIGPALNGQSETKRDKQPGLEYLSYISVLNQLISMSKQLNHDAYNRSNHKYIAHQVALLYQCLNQTRGETKPFKRRIESVFDEVKAITEGSTAPELSDAHKSWLRDMTSDIHRLVSSCPPSMRERLSPVTKVFNSL